MEQNCQLQVLPMASGNSMPVWVAENKLEILPCTGGLKGAQSEAGLWLSIMSAPNHPGSILKISRPTE